MKNTSQKAKFRIIIYKNRNSKKYHSLCYETDQINEGCSLELAKENIIQDVIRRIKLTDCKSKFFEMDILDRQPSLKNRIIFYLYPILSIFFFRCFYSYRFLLDLENGYLTESSRII